MTTPRLIVFDVDGTLVDSQGLILASARAAFAALDLQAPERSAILGCVGLSLPHFMTRLAPGGPAEELAAAYRTAHGDLVRDRAVSPLFPGIRDVLDQLAGEPWTVLGIATGKSRRGLNGLLEAHDLARHFVTIQVADDHPSKPSPSMLHAALAESGVPVQDAMMVGDTSFDMDMAQAAGMTGIAVTWGYHPRSALHSAAHVIDDVAQLAATLSDSRRDA